MKQNPHVHIGTSGWHYDHWLGTFYPRHLAKADFLSYYQKHFHTVEINNSFYQLPAAKTLEDWRDRVATGFIFAAKASRYIYPYKKVERPGAIAPTVFRPGKDPE